MPGYHFRFETRPEKIFRTKLSSVDHFAYQEIPSETMVEPFASISSATLFLKIFHRCKGNRRQP